MSSHNLQLHDKKFSLNIYEFELAVGARAIEVLL